MPDEPTDIPEELLWELDASYAEAEAEQATIKRYDQALSKMATKLAFQEFPALTLMNADQIRAFGDCIRTRIRPISLELCQIAHEAKQNEGN